MIRVIRFMNFIQSGRHVGVRSLLICTTISSYVKCATSLVCLDGSFRFRNFTTNKSVNLINNTDILYNCEIQRGINTTAKMDDLPNLKSANLLKLSDYDCIGFDLDNTLCEYNIATVVQMEFEVLAKFMVEEKGYDPEFLLKPVTDKDKDFFHKGLLIDKNKGNIIHIDKNGTIYRASHGTTILNDDEIIKYYGKDKKWEVANEFVSNILNAWEGPISEQIRALLDYFDMPASLIFARIVDSLDAKLGKPADIYKVWPDVLEGLINMYKREHFSLNKGGFFPRLKANPAKFLNKCHPLLIDWLKDIKKNKKVFIITGSHVDFASFTAEYCLGDDWKSLFDIIICYTRKPGFFTGGRPFIRLNGSEEADPIDLQELQFGNIYSQGNWQELYQFFKSTLNKTQPKCLYFGDHLIQDIYTPAEYTKCDTVAVVEEMNAEGMANVNNLKGHQSSDILTSKTWGSYFGDEKYGVDSIWASIIKKHSKCCVPSLTFLVNNPLNYEINTFNNKEHENADGFYPSLPIGLFK